MSGESHELLARLQEGDSDALELLLEQHLPRLRGFVRLHSGGLLRAREESSDIVQSVCREILTHMDRFQYPSEAGFRQWLYLTAVRKIRHRYRYWLTEKRDTDRDVAPTVSAVDLVACYGSFCTPSREVAAREEISRIEAAFDRLKEEQREVILLAKVVGLSRAEIGERLGKSEAAVRTMLTRALTRLAELLGGTA